MTADIKSLEDAYPVTFSTPFRGDHELEVMEMICSQFEQMDHEVRHRIVSYLKSRYGIYDS